MNVNCFTRLQRFNTFKNSLFQEGLLYSFSIVGKQVREIGFISKSLKGCNQDSHQADIANKLLSSLMEIVKYRYVYSLKHYTSISGVAKNLNYHYFFFPL